MYTVNDLLKMNLSPAEFTAACFMMTREEYGVVRVETSAVADLLHCSPAGLDRTVCGRRGQHRAPGGSRRHGQRLIPQVCCSLQRVGTIRVPAVLRP